MNNSFQKTNLKVLQSKWVRKGNVAAKKRRLHTGIAE
jgi:hypothetical protein